MKNVFIHIIISLLIFSCSKEDIVNTKRFEIQSIKTFGGTKNDALLSIKNTIDGGYIVVGHTQSSDLDITTKNSESYDYWVLKFDENYTLLWSKTFGGSDDDRAKDVEELSDGSFLVTGFSRSTDGDVSLNHGNYDFWVIKLNSVGDLIWEKSFGFSGSDQSYVIEKTNDGGFILGGSLDVTASGGQGNSKTSKRHAGGDYWLIKIDKNGVKLWSHYYGGQFTDALFGVAEADNGNLILVGSSDSSDTDVSNNLGEYDIWVVCTTNTGEMLWKQNFGGNQIDEAFSITKTKDNYFLIAGNSRSSNVNVSENKGSSDVWVFKIDANGTLIWEKSFGGSSFEDAKEIITNTNGDFYLTGSSRSSDFDVANNNGNKDVWVLKLDENGTILWQKNIGGANLDASNSLAFLKDNSLIIAGESWSSDVDITENKGFSDGLIIRIK